jgi:hypothetical protein
MMIYRNELTTGPAAVLRLVLRDLIHEKILVGPVVVNDGTVARLIKLPDGAGRMETWAKGVGWVEAPEGSMALADFMPGKMKPVSARDAARLDIPAAELDNITRGEIAIAKHEMKRPRKIYGLLWGSELPSPRDRTKIVGLIKARAWDLAARHVAPGHA